MSIENIRKLGISRELDPNYVLVYRSKYWKWYAYESTWEKHLNYYQTQLSYPDKVYEELSSLLGLNLVDMVPDKKLYLMVWNQTGGGYASKLIGKIGKGPGIGISYDAWYNPYSGNDTWSFELIAHEAVNVFTGYVITGWPIDWWANTSPFPYALKIIVERKTGHKQAANKSLKDADSLVRFFLRLMRRFGDDIYDRLLKKIASDGWRSWSSLKSGNPSSVLSEYVAAYLSLVTRVNLASELNRAFNSTNMSYSLDVENVRKIIKAEKQLQKQKNRNHPKWVAFREGKINI
jgi:hypothetical protein